MFLSKERKALFVAFLVILAIGCFMIFPLLAQTGDPPPEEGSSPEITESEDAATADEEPVADEPVDSTPEETAAPELIAPTIGTVRVADKPSEFLVRDFPSDEGGVFLISWPKVGRELTLKDELREAIANKLSVRKSQVTETSSFTNFLKEVSPDDEKPGDAPSEVELLVLDLAKQFNFEITADEAKIITTVNEVASHAVSHYSYRIYHTMDPNNIVNGNIRHIEADEESGSEATYTDFEPLSGDLVSVRHRFWPSSKDKNSHAYGLDTPRLPQLDKEGEPRLNADGNPIEKPDFKNEWFFQLAMVDDSDTMEYLAPVQSLVSKTNPFNFLRVNNMLISIIYCFVVMFFITQAKRGKELFIRKIAGLDAVDEAIGRATEMGKPILYLTGLDALSNVSTIAAINILGQVAKKVADYDSKIINPNRDPIVMSVCQEVVKEAYMDAGRPDAYNPDSIFFVTDDQFSFTAAVDGIMVREKPATNIFMGYYYAESLILAETGASTGAIQIAGTDSIAQLPFFITTCDYTLIGEELYAASAYLAREPLLLGSLKGQDVGKMFLMVMLVLGVLFLSISTNLNFISFIFAAE